MPILPYIIQISSKFSFAVLLPVAHPVGLNISLLNGLMGLRNSLSPFVAWLEFKSVLKLVCPQL